MHLNGKPQMMVVDDDPTMCVLGRTTTVVKAMKLGASTFVSRPFEETDLEVPLTNLLRQHQLNREVATLRDQLQSQSKYTMLFGHSERMAAVQDLIECVTDAREAERELFFKMLQQTRWNRKETAEILGISYKALPLQDQ